MTRYQFPLELTFKISTLSNDFVAKNSSGETIGYIKQKLFKFVEHIEIFNNESKSNLLYEIKADRWLDFNAFYSFSLPNGQLIGKVGRKGWVSLWRARYEIFNSNSELAFRIQEDNPFVKVFDKLLGEVPFVNFFVGYFFNPKYSLYDAQGNFKARLIKQRSLFGRKFTIETPQDLSEQDAELIFLGYTMMVLLERRRG